MKKLLLLLLAIVTVHCGTLLFAQEEYIPLPDVAGDPDLAVAEKPLQPFTLNYGGWITPVVMDQRTSDTDLMTSVTIARIWLTTTLWSGASLYVRVKDSYLAVIREDVDIDNTSNVFDLDIAAVTIPVIKNNLRLVLGRKYYVTGAGLVLNGRGDGGEVQLYTRFGDFKAFGMYSGLLNKDDNPYGLSSRDIADGAKRIFASAQYSKDFLYNNTLYMYGLMEIDRQDEDDVKSDYDAQYIGAGVKGVISDKLTYYAEYVYQMGTSYATTIVPGVEEENDIKAMAVLAGLRYYWNVAYKPFINLQYAYGSGDKDATSYSDASDNTFNDDNRFMYFGTFIGGFALRPQLGNLHVIRPGLGFSPFYKFGDRIKAMNLVFYYSYYMKDEKESPIGGGEADLPESFVGQAVDVMLRWPIYYDLSLFANYGLFLPGDAYPSGTPELHFIMTGVNIVF